MPPILCFSTVDWDYLRHRPQIIMSHLAECGYPVVYVDTLGLRSPTIRDWSRIVSRLSNFWIKNYKKQDDLPKGLRVLSPILLPFLNSKLLRRLNIWFLVPFFRKALQEYSNELPIIWVYLPTWTVLECIKRIPHHLLVYECIDALANNPAGVSRGYVSAEAEILRQADLVITTSQELQCEKASVNTNTHWVPAGVDAGFFDVVEPAEQVMDIRGPRIGFFGALDHRLDVSLLKQLIIKHREWSFVLIGPIRVDLDELVSEYNCHYLGVKPYEQIPAFVEALDVVILPYTIDGFTRNIFPAKIYECLALGKPVVASAIPALNDLDEWVYIASDVPNFTVAIQRALFEKKSHNARRRRVLASNNSWDKRYTEIKKYLEELKD